MCAEHSENVNRKWPRNHYFWAFRLLAVSVLQSHLATLRFLNNLGFEQFGIRATLANGNPGDKGERARLKNADTIALNAGVR